MPAPTRPSGAPHARAVTRRVHALAAGAAALALVVAMMPTSSAVASPRQVDPLTLTPALNPTFSWSCAETGSGITCTGERRSTYGPEPAGFDCDGMPVYVTGRGDDRMTRWHTADGLATRTVAQRSFPEDRLTLSADGSGPAVVSRQHWTQHYDYGTPGDVGTRVLVETGQILMVHGPGGAGKVYQVTGRAELAPGEDVSFAGRDDFLAGVDFVAEVCGALT
ncbi:hypothetical protein GCM10023168_10620 [Fodinibacter luteus]|uniref:Secreted protein n=1 Tax=Fodinibacter luteus TaxID=552064 RepID=A0ABP8K6R1_9MICO